jgi:hypothetical protein
VPFRMDTARREAPSAAFVRDDSPGNVRHGKYSARVVLNPGDCRVAILPDCAPASCSRGCSLASWGC